MEKPICLTIANLKQLEAVAPPFSPLLWEFMRHVYPGGIGCIVHKGPWLRKLGMRGRTRSESQLSAGCNHANGLRYSL